MIIRNAALGLAAFTLLVSTAPLLAQGSAAVFSDTVDVEVVNVEVVVTDKDGRPVTGLTRDDFEILEDGQPVQLTNFYAVDDPVMSLGTANVPGQGEGEEPSRPVGSTQDLNLVIFIDNLNIRPENRKLLFENLRKRLRESAVPGSRMMLATMNSRVEVVQPFTDDLDSIHAALDEIEKQTSISALMDGERRMFMSAVSRASLRNMRCTRQSAGPSASGSGGSSGGGVTDPLFDEAVRTAQRLALQIRGLAEQRYQAARGTVASLAAFSDTLGGLPGRKALLYLSDGIPMRPADSITEAWIGKFDQWFQQNEGAIRNCSRVPEAVADLQRAVTSAGSNNFDLHSDFKRLTERASDKRVAFYPISNGGRGASLGSAAFAGSAGGGLAMRNAMVAENMSRDASILQMAEDTGGLAITGNANIGGLFDRVGSDFSTFYSLGYAPPERKGDGDDAFHEIGVKVAREGVTVRHVKGYHAKSWRDRLADMTVASALYELESNPLGIQLQPGEPVHQGGRIKVPVMVQIPFRQIQMVSDGENYSASLSLLVVVLDKKGGFSKPRRFDLPIKIPNAQILQAREQSAGYPLELEMKKDARRVAVGVRDHIGETASCLKLDFDFGGDSGKKKKKKARKG